MAAARRRRTRRLRAGFTLIELLIALSLVGLIGSWLVRFVGAQQRAYGRQSEMVAATRNARAGAELLLAEARNAGFDPRGIGAGVTHATPDSFGWTADLNGDGDVDDFGVDGDETVLYFYDHRGRRMMRRTNRRPAAVVEDLDTLLFRYVDRRGRPASDPGMVAGIEAEIRFTALGGELEATIPVATRLRNGGGR